MNLRREVIAAFAALIMILLLTSLGAAGLFARMSPAIEKIIRENDYSLEACERMLAVLAALPISNDPAGLRANFDEALTDARDNVTEPEEPPQLEAISATAPRAFAGDAGAMSSTVDSVRRLADVNRDAMKRVDREARRLGAAGAWSAVFLGLLGFTVGLLVVERLLQKIVKPLLELQSVLTSAMSGDRTRRCIPGSAAPDIEFLMLGVNTLLDLGVRSDAPTGRDVLHCRAARTVLVHLLDKIDEPRAVVDTSGAIIAANAATIALLRGSTGERIKERLVKAAGERDEGFEWVVARFPDAQCVLCKPA